MQFRYRAIDQSGNDVTGVLEGRDERDAIRQVSRQNLTVVSISEDRVVARRRRGRASTRELQRLQILHFVQDDVKEKVALYCSLRAKK